MGTSGVNALPSKASELWIDGLHSGADAIGISTTITPNVVDVTVLESEIGQTHKEIPDADITLNLLYKSRGAEARIYDKWDSGIVNQAPLPVLISIGNGLRVGEQAIGICVQPVDMTIDSNAKDVIRLTLSCRSDGALVYGVIRSSQTSSGNQPMRSATSTDFAAQAFTGRGGATPVYTPTVAASHGADTTATAIIGTVRSLTGSPGTVPTHTFSIPQSNTAWAERGEIAGSDAGQRLTIGHTVNGTLVNKVSPPWGTHNLVSQVLDWVEAQTWADGFRITAVDTTNPSGNQTSVIFRGTQGGEDKDIVFAASNTIPTGGAWTGTYTGADGGLTARLVTATGTGGSRVYTGQGEPFHIDETPASQMHIVPNGAAQFGLALIAPAKDPGDPDWNWGANYSIATITDGDYGS